MNIKLPVSESVPSIKLRRRCGACSACCTSMGVVELVKPEGARCIHMRDGVHACTIYERRPPSCRGFRCAWLTEPHMLTEDDRPDKSGVIFFWQVAEGISDEPILTLKEIEPGAFDKTRVRFSHIDKRLLVLVMYATADGTTRRTLLGPPEQVMAVYPRVKRVAEAEGVSVEKVVE